MPEDSENIGHDETPVSPKEFRELVFTEGMRPTLPIKKEPKIGRFIHVDSKNGIERHNMGTVEKIERPAHKTPGVYRITTELGTFEAVIDEQ